MKVCLTIFLFISFHLFSQKKESYLHSIVDTTSSISLKLNALDSLSNYYKKNNNHIKFAIHAERFIHLALLKKQYKRAANKAIQSFYTINNRLGKREKALQLLNDVEQYAFEIKDSSILGKIYLKKGGAYFNGKDYNKALKNYNLAKRFFNDKDSLFKADAIYFKGQVYYEKGNYLKALRNFNLASKYYENLGDLEYYNFAIEGRLSIYGALGFNRKSIKERKKKQFTENKAKIKDGLILNYYNLSIDYQKINNPKKQLEYLLKADSLINLEKEVKTYIQIDVNTALAKFYADRDLKKANAYLKKAATKLKSMDNNVFGYQSYRIAKGYILFKEKKYKKAKKVLFKALNQPKNTFNIKDEIELYRVISLVYKEMQSPSVEVFFLRKHYSKKDSLEKRTKINSLNFYQSLFESKKKEKKISDQNTSIQLLEAKNRSNRIIIFFVSIGFFLFIIITVLLFKKIALKRKNLLKVQFAQNLLLSQEEERNRIAKDLHDSLGQSLLLIKNEISIKNDTYLKKLIDNSINEIRSISRGLHPFQLQQKGINDALENLVYELDNSFKDLYIFGDFDDIKDVLSKDEELNLFRIIQELLSNVIKHSKAKSARIKLINKKFSLLLYVKDNGIGFNFSEKYNDPKSLGLKTIRERIRFLKGSIKIESFINDGTSITIKIPKK